jgi:hypothetical protein
MAREETLIKIKGLVEMATWSAEKNLRRLSKQLGNLDKEHAQARKNTEAFGNATDKTSKAWGAAALSFKSAGLALTGLIGTISGAIHVTGRLAQEGGKIVTMMDAFNRTTNTTAGGGLQAMRTATHGLIADYRLLEQFNKGVALGAIETRGEFVRLADAAIRLGRAMNVDAAFALESLTLGIGRQSRLFLDNLGLIVKVEEAYRRYGLAIGRAGDQLTESEQKEAFRIETFRQIAVAMEDLGPIALNAGDAFTQFSNSVRNSVDALKIWLAESELVGKFFRELAGVIDAFRLGISTAVIDKTLARGIATNADELKAMREEAAALEPHLKRAGAFLRALGADFEGDFPTFEEAGDIGGGRMRAGSRQLANIIDNAGLTSLRDLIFDYEDLVDKIEVSSQILEKGVEVGEIKVPDVSFATIDELARRAVSLEQTIRGLDFSKAFEEAVGNPEKAKAMETQITRTARELEAVLTELDKRGATGAIGPLLSFDPGETVFAGLARMRISLEEAVRVSDVFSDKLREIREKIEAARAAGEPIVGLREQAATLERLVAGTDSLATRGGLQIFAEGELIESGMALEQIARVWKELQRPGQFDAGALAEAIADAAAWGIRLEGVLSTVESTLGKDHVIARKLRQEIERARDAGNEMTDATLPFFDQIRNMFTGSVDSLFGGQNLTNIAVEAVGGALSGIITGIHERPAVRPIEPWGRAVRADVRREGRRAGQGDREEHLGHRQADPVLLRHGHHRHPGRAHQPGRRSQKRSRRRIPVRRSVCLRVPAGTERRRKGRRPYDGRVQRDHAAGVREHSRHRRGS